jgi:protein TonB
MNFDSTHKNYSGLAFVIVLHLVAAGIALKNSTVWITRGDPGPISVLPPKALPPEPQPEPTDHFDVPRSNPLSTPVLPDIPFKIDAGPTITTTRTDDPVLPRDSGVRVDGEGGGNVDKPRREPVTVAAVIEAAGCAKPAYPAAALRNGDEGTVTLAFLIGKDGRVASAKVERTSGHRDLDRAALQGLSLCAFKPGTVDGVPQESWARMQYAWTLDS